MINEKTFYNVSCDRCGADSCEGHDYSYWGDKSYALEVAMEADFEEINEGHYCPDCYEYDDDDNLIIKTDEK